MPDLPARITRFEQLGFGLFVHWGLYALVGEGEWVWHHHRLPRDGYLDLQRRFTASGFDARRLARQARAAGCRYLVFTTRHHDGFSLYDTRGLNTWDSLHAPAARDLVAEVSAACEAEGLGKFFYHTTLDWWHPHFDDPGRWDDYQAYLRASVEILCTAYGRVDGFWFDGNWARRGRDWQEDALYALIRRHQADAIIVNNSSVGALGAPGHPEVDVRTFEQGQPGRERHPGSRATAREMCDTIGSHWGLARDDLSQQSPGAVIRKLVACRAVGANYLLNVGPEADGTLAAYDAALLEVVGRWTSLCPDALTLARPTDLVCRGADGVVRLGSTYFYFAHDLEIHENAHLAHGEGSGLRTVLGDLPPVRRITWMDTGEDLAFTQTRVGAEAPSGPGRQPLGERSLLAFHATPWPYGHQRVVRVARIDSAT